MVEHPAEIDPLDKSTWVKPVDSARKDTDLANIYWAEYALPVSPNAMLMAIYQLPSFVPRGVLSFPRFLLTKSNIERDGRHKGTFAIEVAWPKANIFLQRYDDTDL